MTPTHRKRLLIAAALVIVGLASAASPMFASDGPWAALGLFAMSAIAPAIVLGIIAWVWHSNDKERMTMPDASRPLPRP